MNFNLAHVEADDLLLLQNAPTGVCYKVRILHEIHRYKNYLRKWVNK